MPSGQKRAFDGSLCIEEADARVLMEFLAGKSEDYAREMKRLRDGPKERTEPDPPADPQGQFALWLELHKKKEAERFQNAARAVGFLVRFPDSYKIPTPDYEEAYKAYQWVMKESNNLRRLSVDLFLSNYDEWVKAEGHLHDYRTDF